MKLKKEINNRDHVVQANKHSYDKFVSHLKVKGTYLGYVNNGNQQYIDYYYCNGYVCNVIREHRDIVGAGLTVDINRIPKNMVEAYSIEKG